jgi:hypothetical protein
MVLNRSIEDPCILLEPGHLTVTYIDPPLLKKLSLILIYETRPGRRVSTMSNGRRWDDRSKNRRPPCGPSSSSHGARGRRSILWRCACYVRVLLRLVLLVILHVHFAMRQSSFSSFDELFGFHACISGISINSQKPAKLHFLLSLYEYMYDVANWRQIMWLVLG